MLKSWLDILDSGTLNLSLPSLTLTIGSTDSFNGSGRAVWRQGDAIKIEGITKGGDHLLRNRFGHPMGTVGELFPRDIYLTATGRTQDGWELTSTAIPLDGYSLHTESEDVLWGFGVRFMSMTQLRDEPAHTPVIRALLTPGLPEWPRGSSVTDQNPRFGGCRSQLDWLETRAANGVLSLRQRGEKTAELLYIADDDAPSIEPNALLTALTRACAFLIGRRVFVLGHEAEFGNRTERSINGFVQPPTRCSMLKPLGKNLAFTRNCEQLLGKAVDFLLTDEGEELASHLALCWDSNDNLIASRLTIVSIALEGMLKMLPEHGTRGDLGFTSEDEGKLKIWAEENLPPRFVSRIQSWLGGLKKRRPIDVLYDWAKRGIMEVTEEDAKAWDRTRNSGAHGTLATPAKDREELQTRMTRFHRVMNLVNKLTLAMIGYQGEFQDYARVGWPEVTFPNVAKDQL